MAGANAAQQAAIAAQVSGQVAGQRQQAANSLMNYGLSGLQGALGAAGTGVTAAGLPFADYSKLASLEFGTPPASYSNMGPTGTTTSGKSATFAPKF
jgi:hypothetical protein